MSEWNPRYVLYAKAHGATPEEMLKRDEKRWPGGKMVGFTQWIQERWLGWDKARGYATREIGQFHAAGDGHADFDKWLREVT